MSAPTRDDCGIETLALLRRCPDARGFVGACIVTGGRSLLTLQPVPGLALPWDHHVWAIGADGVLIDPTAAELLPAACQDWYEPPAPLEQLQPLILWERSAQDAALTRLRPLAVADPTPCPPLEGGAKLLYLPGRVADSLGPHWQRLARKSTGPRGFGAGDLAQALGPAHAGRCRAPRPGRGFALEAG